MPSPNSLEETAAKPRSQARIRFSLLLFGFAVLAGLASSSATAQPLAMPTLRERYPEDYHPSLQTEGKAVPGLVVYGPDAEECVRFEPEGLRISLPANFPRQRPGTGVVTDFGVQGDFEITIGYELFGDGRPPSSGNPTLVKLVVVPVNTPRVMLWQRTNQNRASLSRELPRPKTGSQFVAAVSQWKNEPLPKDKWGNEDFKNLETETTQQFPASAKSGRLRMVRNGSELFFFVGDGNDNLTLMHRVEFGTKDLKNVRVLASTGWMGTALDVRVTDLQIRAEAFPKSAGESVPTVPESGDEAPPSIQTKVIRLGLSVAAGMACLLGIYYVFLRRRAPAPTPIPSTAAETAVPPISPSITTPAAEAPPIVFACPGCGKKLRVKAQNAGTKLKCPGCGTVIPPQPGTVNPEVSP